MVAKNSCVPRCRKRPQIDAVRRDAADPATLLVSVSVLLVSAVCAGYLPARRAARLEPSAALRAE